MTNLNEREKLIQELFIAGQKWSIKSGHIPAETFEQLGEGDIETIGFIADFILEDRKRILKPLINPRIDMEIDPIKRLKNSIEETLQLSGITEEDK
jgi:hypothetical protein